MINFKKLARFFKRNNLAVVNRWYSDGLITANEYRNIYAVAVRGGFCDD